jgi:hypothetical protein
MSKTKIYEQLKLLMNGYTDKLVRELVKRKLLIQLKNPAGHYRLSTGSQKTGMSVIPAQKSVFTQLFELRNIALNVCSNLYPDPFTQPLSFSRSFLKLDENNAITIPWKKDKHLLDTLDKLDNLVNDDDIPASLEKLLNDHKININQIIVTLLEFYGREKTIRFFESLKYNSLRPLSDTSADLIMGNNMVYYSPLIFEFKVRRANAVPDKKMLLGALKRSKELAIQKNQRPYIFLIIFTHENDQSFETSKFRFRETLKAIKEFDSYNSQIEFIPISFSGLHLIDRSFDEFYKNYIQDFLTPHFSAQPPPPGFPDRNDHFLDREFDVRQTELIINIKPVNTPFWRVGIRFVKEGKFPSLASGRHGNPEVADIHICVGEIINTKTNEWGNPNQLKLNHYNATVIENHMGSLLNYDGGSVTLVVTSNAEASEVLFSVDANGKHQGNRKFNLQAFGTCKIFAWADYLSFNLETEIKVIHKGK